MRCIYATQATPLYYGTSATSSSLGDKRRLVHHPLRLLHRLLLRLLHRLLLISLLHRLLLRILHRLLLRLLHRLLLRLLRRVLQHLPSQELTKLHRLPAQGQRRRRKLTPPITKSHRTIACKRSLTLTWQQK